MFVPALSLFGGLNLKILMKSNVFKIPERLKEIDRSYFVMYDDVSGKYEVHSTENKDGNTHCLTLPYEELDCRAIDLVRKTRVENARRIWEEMKRENERLEIERAAKAKDYIDYTARDIYRYLAPKSTVDTIPDDAYSTRFA